LLLDFPHITRRIAAQRSRFIVFGTEPTWLSEQIGSTDSLIKASSFRICSTLIVQAFIINDSTTGCQGFRAARRATLGRLN